MASRVSETVPIWFTLIRAELAMPSAIAWVMIAGLVQKMSSPTSWIRPPRAAVRAFQPSRSDSPSPSSMLQIGNASTMASYRATMSALENDFPFTLYVPSAWWNSEAAGSRAMATPSTPAVYPASVMEATISSSTSSGSARLGAKPPSSPRPVA